MKKQLSDLTVVEKQVLNSRHVLLKLTHKETLPEILPGQFVEVLVEDSPSTFLRRPISVNFVDRDNNQLWLLIQTIGEGTRHLGALKPGQKVNVLFPLGNGFTIPQNKQEKILLVGGGVGIAPLLYLGDELQRQGIKNVAYLLGARTESDLLLIDNFSRFGRVFFTTEDGSAGQKGFVTQHSLLQEEDFDCIYCCGPKPMMISVAKYAKAKGITCEVSLENKMACGLGACLCCVENTKDGNVCVCKDGPVFNINDLLWQI
mgnify:CR=1 FL=1